MKLAPRNPSLLAVTISILVAALAPTTVGAFAVHAQTAGMASSLVHDSNHARRSSENPRSSLAISNRHGSLNGMPTRTATTSLSALPGLGPFAAAAFLPPCLGLWRTGYAVSYGYGGVMLASGLLQLLALSGEATRILPLQVHAAIYVFYGLRLNLFLLNREIRLPVEINMMKRRDDSWKQRLKRLPVIIGSSVLFFCMAAGPMRALALVDPQFSILNTGLLAVGFSGFLLAAIGDWYKSKIKARDGPQKLVTTGPFRYFRHPNYTGEMIGWTCVCLLLPLLNAITAGGNVRKVLPWLMASSIGWAGMVFAVLIQDATVGLERKHKEKYGGTPEYEEWIKTSWSGPMPGAKKES